MNRADKELEELGKRILAPLRETPQLDAGIGRQEKAKFLTLAAGMQESLVRQPGSADMPLEQMGYPSAHGQRPRLIIKALAATLLALFILVGSSLTVFAAQDSLPGDALYQVKSWSEDIRLSLTSSPQARLNLTLDYTERRVDEIASLAVAGKPLPGQASERLMAQLESSLQLAAQLDDAEMHFALGRIKRLAESQGMTVEELLNSLPDQAKPALLHLRQRLQEQVELSTIGEDDPKTFRQEIKRRHDQPGNKKNSPGGHDSQPGADNTPEAAKTTPEGDDIGTGSPSTPPGNEGNGGGQGKPNPGNGNHGPGPSTTTEP